VSLCTIFISRCGLTTSFSQSGLTRSDREELKASIEGAGGVMEAQLTEKTTHLLCDYDGPTISRDGAQTKFEVAVAAGIPVLSPDWQVALSSSLLTPLTCV
jgi:hypothetical protein